MSAQVLLVAGPSTLSTQRVREQATRWWSGAGFYAAAASAALTPTQLWSRSPTDTSHDESQLLERRRIDSSGCSPEADAATPDSVLPELEPVDATDLGACLCVGLTGADLIRARRVIAALPDSVRRVEVLQLPPSATAADLDACQPRTAQQADANQPAGKQGQSGDRNPNVLILPVSLGQQLTGQATPTAAIDTLLERGHSAVLLTGGPLGGIAGYKAKRWVWPAVPHQAADAPDDCPDRGCCVFAGVVAALSARHGRLDWRHLKRWTAEAGAVAGTAVRKPGPIGLMQLDSNAYQQAFVSLRRNNKY